MPYARCRCQRFDSFCHADRLVLVVYSRGSLDDSLLCSLPASSNAWPPGGGGGGTLIHKLYGDVPPFRVWFFDRPLINRVSNSKIFEDFV